MLIFGHIAVWLRSTLSINPYCALSSAPHNHCIASITNDSSDSGGVANEHRRLAFILTIPRV